MVRGHTIILEQRGARGSRNPAAPYHEESGHMKTLVILLAAVVTLAIAGPTMADPKTGSSNGGFDGRQCTGTGC